MNRPCIVCVDDSEINLRYLQKMLADQYDVVTARSGMQALELLKQLDPYLLILDLLMPDMSGYDVVRSIRSSDSHATLPILMVTALSDRQARLTCFDLGCNDFLTKPFDRFELLARVKTHVNLHHATREVILLCQQSLNVTEQALHRQEQLLLATLNSITDLIYCKDLDGVYLGCNPAFGRLVGRLPGQVTGCTDFDLFPRELAEFYHAQDRLMLESHNFYSYEEWLTYADGQQVLVESKKMPLRASSSEVIGLISISRDMTERKKMENALTEQTLRLEVEVHEREQAQIELNRHAHELAELNRTLATRVGEEVRKNREKDAQMLQQDKLASIGQLAAGVAHEINNPIGFVMGNLHSLKAYGTALAKYCRLLDEAAGETVPGDRCAALQAARKELDIDYIMNDLEPLLDESLDGTERVRRIVLDLKDFARSDSVVMEEADLNQLIRSTINIVANELKYVATVDLQLEELPLLFCHPQQINQVISNLLVNAAHAIDQQGVITVRTWVEHEAVYFSVADTGKGISQEVMKRIFEPFFTTKEVGKGTGLGLSISYDIIKKHGGDIAVISEVGTGTTFMVSLPLTQISSQSGEQ